METLEQLAPLTGPALLHMRQTTQNWHYSVLHKKMMIFVITEKMSYTEECEQIQYYSSLARFLCTVLNTKSPRASSL